MGVTIKTKNARETQKFGEEFAAKIKDGGVVFLYGELGAGKTTFVQGVAKGLGISRRIVSPTFIIVRQYGNFYHIDLYRLNDQREIEALGLQELWQNPKNIILIEWPEKLKTILPKRRWELKFKSEGENEKEIKYEVIS